MPFGQISFFSTSLQWPASGNLQLHILVINIVNFCLSGITLYVPSSFTYFPVCIYGRVYDSISSLWLNSVHGLPLSSPSILLGLFIYLWSLWSLLYLSFCGWKTRECWYYVPIRISLDIYQVGDTMTILRPFPGRPIPQIIFCFFWLAALLPHTSSDTFTSSWALTASYLLHCFHCGF